MSPEIALQKAIRTRLVLTEDVVALVPAASILDRNQRPNPRPSVIIGEGQSVDEGESIGRALTRVYADLHVWVKEPSTEVSKAIAGAIRNAVRIGRFAGVDGFHFADCRIANTRFLRDPDGETSHAVVTVEAIVEEI
ncbi:DUF3168 domain-containing protein [Pararhizobium sp. YC-54]|uniref:DUF3168 domain-containing protein n=1 Tax=Pararhizobium sp. YC-54 TaxID=2986920 RepID=UPI0021F70E1D|nr:DUF3168 domain-containing protein [Pararhizobium sp. YC-54]MCV9997679.1 DUF3168 domain-containing protein [Pararhizobium sp. YC-54]